MSDNLEAILDHFFGITDDVIQRDLERARQDPETIDNELEALRSMDVEDRSAEIEGDIHHLTMLAAYAESQLPYMIPEFKVLHAGFAAGHLTRVAEAVALEKGKYADLSKKLEAIRKREGLSSDQFWARGEGPEDYEALEDEYGELSRGIGDTVFLHTLRRYGLYEPADLYETDTDEFEIQREIGRRVMFPFNEDQEKMAELIDSNLLEKHGAGVLTRIHRRVEEIKALMTDD